MFKVVAIIVAVVIAVTVLLIGVHTVSFGSSYVSEVLDSHGFAVELSSGNGVDHQLSIDGHGIVVSTVRY